MSTYENPLSAARSSPAKRWLPGMKFLRLLGRGFRRWQRTRARATLEQLDDRQLAEIGIARNAIPWAVEELFRSSERSIRTSSPSFRTGGLPKSGRRPEVLGSLPNGGVSLQVVGGIDGQDNEDNHRGRRIRANGHSDPRSVTFGEPGLHVGLGPLGLSYILRAGGMGYFRKGAITPHVETGELEIVEGAPEFTYPAYAVYPEASAGRSDVREALRGLTEVVK